MINVDFINFELLAKELNCEFNPKTIKKKNEIFNYFSMNVLTDKGITLGNVTFKDGLLWKTKEYKPDYIKTIDENEWIFYRMRRFFDDGQTIPDDEFRRLIDKAKAIVQEDLERKIKYREDHPKKGRKKLEGKNPRFILWDLVQKWSPLDNLSTLEKCGCPYCHEMHAQDELCEERLLYDKDVQEINNMVQQPVVNVQASDQFHEFIMSEEGSKIIQEAIEFGVKQQKNFDNQIEDEKPVKKFRYQKGEFSLLCAMFGHKPPCESKNPGGDYAVVYGDYEDGVHRRHAEIYADCVRCGKTYRVCRIHIPDDPKINLCVKTLEAALRISDLWLPPPESKPVNNYEEGEHDGEYQALSMMYSDFKDLVRRLKKGG